MPTWDSDDTPLKFAKSIARHPVEGRDWAFISVARPAPAFAGVTKLGKYAQT